MSKLVIKLNEDGSVYQYAPDFKIMRGSYQNVLINIEVPHSLLIDPVNDTDDNKTKTGNNVRVGGIITTVTGKHLQTKRYEFKRVKDFVREGVTYRLYQRKMPKVFTMWDTLDEREEAQGGSLLLVINVINWTKNELNAKVEEVSASPSFKLDVEPSTYLGEAEEIEEPSDFDILQSQVQDQDKEIDDLKKDLYGEGDETLGEFLTSRLKAGWKILLKKENGKVKISVDTIKAKEVPIDIVNDLPAQNVQKAIEEIWKRVDFKFVDSLTGEDDYLVDNTDPHNPVILHDKSKVDVESIVDNLTTEDFNKVLSARQGVVLKTAIDEVKQSLSEETKSRTESNSSLQENIKTEENSRIQADNTLQEQIDSLSTTKASKTEMAEAIENAVNSVVNSAPAAFDTLKEISDWIAKDEKGTAALVLNIGEIEKKNQEQDEALANEISARESSETAIKESISSETSARETADTTLQGKIDAEIAAREKAVETLTNSKLDDIQIESGTNNGTIKLVKVKNQKSTTEDNIPITGLGSAAFTDISKYATAEQGKRADLSIDETAANNLIRDAVDEVKDQLQSNIDDVSTVANKAVLFEAQTLTEQQKAQARSNIGAGASTFSGSYNDLGQKPVINTSNSESLETNENEVVQGTLNLHKISKTGKLADAVTDSEHETISAAQKTQIETNKSNIESNDVDISDLQKRMSTVEDNIDTIEDKIPTQTSASNQLADKNFVNSSINNLAAYYITKDDKGNSFATNAELLAAKTFYNGATTRVPTTNDYAIVQADETKQDELGNSPTTRYSYQGGTYPNGKWVFQYIVNETPFTAAQIAAINSNITADLTAQITTNKNAITGKASQTDLASLIARVEATETKNTSQDTAITKAQTTADNAMPKSGGVFTGNITLPNLASLKISEDGPAYNSPTYVCVFNNNAAPQGLAYCAVSNLAAQMKDYIYPVGSIYISVVDTSPASFLGGTWEKIRGGFALVTTEYNPADEANSNTWSGRLKYSDGAPFYHKVGKYHIGGVPDIGGTVSKVSDSVAGWTATGAFYDTVNAESDSSKRGGLSKDTRYYNTIVNFLASKSNNAFGKYQTGLQGTNFDNFDELNGEASYGTNYHRVVATHFAVYAWRRIA